MLNILQSGNREAWIERTLHHHFLAYITLTLFSAWVWEGLLLSWERGWPREELAERLSFPFTLGEGFDWGQRDVEQYWSGVGARSLLWLTSERSTEQSPDLVHWGCFGTSYPPGLGSQRFLRYNNKSTSMKEKSEKLGFIEIKSFQYLKDTIKQMKGQVIYWEKIIPSHISDKGLVCRIYKKISKVNSE